MNFHKALTRAGMTEMEVINSGTDLRISPMASRWLSCNWKRKFEFQQSSNCDTDVTGRVNFRHTSFSTFVGTVFLLLAVLHEE